MTNSLEIEYVDIDQLTPYCGNAKMHPRQQVEQIAKSIQEFGMNDPVAVWTNSKGELEIVEGHGRLYALDMLGIRDVPIIRLDRLTDEQRRAYTHVHNQLTLNSGFDLGILNEEMESLPDFDWEDFGFAQIEEDDDVGCELEKKPEVEFTEVLGEEHNYLVLYFDNEMDWMQALTLFDVKPVKAFSTRMDGSENPKTVKRGTGRVLKGGEALERLSVHTQL